MIRFGMSLGWRGRGGGQAAAKANAGISPLHCASVEMTGLSCFVLGTVPTIAYENGAVDGAQSVGWFEKQILRLRRRMTRFTGLMTSLEG
jgi:hypothetical protein